MFLFDLVNRCLEVSSEFKMNNTDHVANEMMFVCLFVDQGRAPTVTLTSYRHWCVVCAHTLPGCPLKRVCERVIAQ